MLTGSKPNRRLPKSKGPRSGVRKPSQGQPRREALVHLGRAGPRKSRLRSGILFLWPHSQPYPPGMTWCIRKK